MAQRAIQEAIDFCNMARRSGSGNPLDLRRMQRKLSVALDQVHGARQRSFRPWDDEASPVRESGRKPTEEQAPQEESELFTAGEEIADSGD